MIPTVLAERTSARGTSKGAQGTECVCAVSILAGYPCSARWEGVLELESRLFIIKYSVPFGTWNFKGKNIVTLSGYCTGVRWTRTARSEVRSMNDWWSAMGAGIAASTLAAGAALGRCSSWTMYSDKPLWIQRYGVLDVHFTLIPPEYYSKYSVSKGSLWFVRSVNMSTLLGLFAEMVSY